MYPDFEIHVDYEQLRGGNYRFRLLKPVTIYVEELESYREILSLRDGNETEWALIEGCTITISAGYAWNGASPKWWVPLIGWVGTPDPESTRLATLFHDVMFQFIRVDGFPINFIQANSIFRRIMVAKGFRFSNTYFGAVTDFGKRFITPPTNGEHSVLLTSPHLDHK